MRAREVIALSAQAGLWRNQDADDVWDCVAATIIKALEANGMVVIDQRRWERVKQGLVTAIAEVNEISRHGLAVDASDYESELSLQPGDLE